MFTSVAFTVTDTRPPVLSPIREDKVVCCKSPLRGLKQNKSWEWESQVHLTTPRLPRLTVMCLQTGNCAKSSIRISTGHCDCNCKSP